MTEKLHHPLEDVFNMDHDTPLNLEQRYDRLDPALIPMPTQEQAEAQAVPDVKDDDDIAMDKKLDEVYDAAITTFHNQTAYTEIIEPRYAARNAEVAAQYLGLALNAVTAKAKVKSDRKRTNAAFIPYNNNRTNSNIVADRNDILSLITVDSETKEIK